ncbi:hypothetical protein MUO79_01400 [Candidatus Bathyarchaeota archaeon]|nr:hypothetical protein [Candidatus Bathyarchaeota archaeon]
MNDTELTMRQCQDFIKKNFSSFREIYATKEEMLGYCGKFRQIYKDSEDASSEFLVLHKFYMAMRKMENSLVKLIMITSLIERLNSREDYTDFLNWYCKNKESKLANKDLKKLWKEYNDKFGCSGKFRRFFKNKEYLTKENQLVILRSIITFTRKGNGQYSRIHPFCYEKTCPQVLSSSTCPFKKSILYECDYPKCSLGGDSQKLGKRIGYFADFLYEIRNHFVHDAKMFSLPTGTAKFDWDKNLIHLRYKFPCEKSATEKRILCCLGAKQLEQILNRNFKKLIDSYITSRESESKANLEQTAKD